MDAATILKTTRLDRGLDQARLARRAGTTQSYISRVERGAISPSPRTLDRLFHAMGRRLSLTTEPLSPGNVSVRDLRSDFRELTPGERLEQAMELSSFLTEVAASDEGTQPMPSDEHRTEPGGAPRGLRPRELLGRLHDHGVEFDVIGGFALAPHGYVRATKDLDIVPEPSPGNLARLAAALRDLDARVDLGDLGNEELGPISDEQGLRAGGNWALLTRLGRLDVMQDVPGLRDYAQLREGAVDVNGTRYAGYDELISMKVASGRVEDLRDIGALESARDGG